MIRKRYHTGRAPLEAAALGVNLAPGEVAFRCNLVTLRHEGAGLIMEDYAAWGTSPARKPGRSSRCWIQPWAGTDAAFTQG